MAPVVAPLKTTRVVQPVRSAARQLAGCSTLVTQAVDQRERSFTVEAEVAVPQQLA